MYTFNDDDLFGRELIANELTSMISETSKPFSIALDSNWGSGKSVFLMKWKNKLENDNYKTIYIDAWKTDYYVDPIIPIVGTLNQLLELDNADFGDLRSAFIVIIKDILKKFTKIDYDEILESFENKSRNDNSVFISYEEQRNLIKEKLTEYSDKHGKVYFFIDELDRCKPLFAINFLERIKHFLDIPNFVFIFSIDLKQLGYSIKHIYGDISSDSYFRKFFDIVYNLPIPSSKVFFKFLIDKNSFRKQNNYLILDRIESLISINSQIGLRECEKIYEIIRISNHKIISISGYEFIFPYIIFMKVLEPSLYKEFIRKESNWSLVKLEEWKFREAYSISDYGHVFNLFNILGKIKREDRILENESIKWKRSELDYSMADYAISCIEFGKTF